MEFAVIEANSLVGRKSVLVSNGSRPCSDLEVPKQQEHPAEHPDNCPWCWRFGSDVDVSRMTGSWP